MKSQNKQKIMMLFSGIAGKYSENPDYFLGAQIEFVSGGKKFNGTVKEIEGVLEYSFLSKRRFESVNDLLSAVCDDMLKYDSATFSYRERGKTTVISADDRNVKISATETEGEYVDTAQLRSKDYIINPQKAQKLMRVLGYLTEDGKIKNDMIRKYNQTERFIELIAPMFDDIKDNTTLRIVDCACGKSYLSFVLNYYLWEVRRIKAKFIGIDISENVIAESRKMAEELNYKNMEFICEDLRYYDGAESPDIVISLHACDVATDMALGYAIRRGAKKIICVPCCHKELLDKYRKDDLAPIIKHGVMRARLNDILTDGLRMAKLEAVGYSVSCVEYCSPLDTPKNLLIRAEKIKKSDKAAEKAYYDLLSELSVMPSVEAYSMISDEE
ncbi:MAG: SAM-dependent methyltransferase [Ruminococcaceae bacterium]|nr:SAM-dependent methyltransferase [Oscillospiraceae bacterium]